jgi:hypothetical protein
MNCAYASAQSSKHKQCEQSENKMEKLLDISHRITGFLDCVLCKSIIENTTFWKLDLFQSSGEEGKGRPTLLSSPSLHLRMETDPVSEVLCFLVI